MHNMRFGNAGKLRLRRPLTSVTDSLVLDLVVGEETVRSQTILD